MSIQFPAAPASFYAPSLQTLKDKLTPGNVALNGYISLLVLEPNNVDKAWNQAGVAANTDLSYNRGTHVIGFKELDYIEGPIASTTENSNGEVGYKLQFSEITDVPIYINGSGNTTAIVIGAALVEKVHEYSIGNGDNILYFIGFEPQVVQDCNLFDVPEFEIIINYGTPLA